ncbi:MAG: hypothetical protein ACE5FT_00450 [Candidatus Nanoarchaeia archaeon]
MKTELVEGIESYLRNDLTVREESADVIALTQLEELLLKDSKNYERFLWASHIRLNPDITLTSNPIRYIQQCGMAVLEFVGLDWPWDIHDAYLKQRESLNEVQKYLSYMQQKIGKELPKLRKAKKRAKALHEKADLLIEDLETAIDEDEEQIFHKALYSERIRNKQRHSDIALNEYQLAERALRAIYASVLFMHDHATHASEIIETTLNAYEIMSNWTGLGKTFFNTLDQVDGYRKEMRNRLMAAVNQSRQLANLSQPYTQQLGAESPQYVPE